MGKRIAYVRTSRERQDGEAQIHECRQWAKAHSEDVEIVLERGECGARDDRPLWRAIMRDVEAGKVDLLVATEISRMSRSTIAFLKDMKKCYECGVRVVAIRQSIDFGTPMGKMTATIFVAVAEYERETIIERVRSGMRRAREGGTRSGLPIGRPPKVKVLRGAALALVGRGKRVAEIARELRVSVATVRRCLKGNL